MAKEDSRYGALLAHRTTSLECCNIPCGTFDGSAVEDVDPCDGVDATNEGMDEVRYT